MIRIHGNIFPPGQVTKNTDVNKEEVGAIWEMVALVKKEGIYSTISPFWANNYAAINLVSMDNKDIGISSKILVQAGRIQNRKYRKNAMEMC